MMKKTMSFWMGTALFAGPVIFAAAPAQPAPLVSVLRAVEIKETYAKRYAGEIKPVEEVGIVPRVTGVIQKIHFKEGSMVKAGDLLFEIEDVTYRAKVDSARAAVEQLEIQLKYNNTNYQRQHTLLKSKAVSQSVFDEAEEQRDSIKAKLLAAKADLHDAQNTLSYTRIHAPISGRIGKCSLTPGNLVNTATGEIVSITQIAPIYVEFAIGERMFRADFGGRLNFPKQADIRVELADGTMYKDRAEVAIIDSKVDKSTNTIKIWGEFKNEKQDLIPGSYVTVNLGVRNPGKLVGILPSALQIDNHGPYVYVLDSKDIAQRRSIVPGSVNGNIQEVKAGLNVGDRVVVDGMHKLRPGVPAKCVDYQNQK